MLLLVNFTDVKGTRCRGPEKINKHASLSELTMWSVAGVASVVIQKDEYAATYPVALMKSVRWSIKGITTATWENIHKLYAYHL